MSRRKWGEQRGTVQVAGIKGIFIFEAAWRVLPLLLEALFAGLGEGQLLGGIAQAGELEVSADVALIDYFEEEQALEGEFPALAFVYKQPVSMEF